jgi:hypothetical protein
MERLRLVELGKKERLLAKKAMSTYLSPDRLPLASAFFVRPSNSILQPVTLLRLHLF